MLGAVAKVNDLPVRTVKVDSGVTDLFLHVDYSSDPSLPAPTRIFGPDRVRVQGRLVGLIRRY